MDKKIIKQEISQEESNQITGMFNWANNNDDIMMMDLKMFKQYNSKDKHYRTVFEVSSIHWTGQQHKTARGNGSTLIEAMKNYSMALINKGMQ